MTKKEKEKNLSIQIAKNIDKTDLLEEQFKKELDTNPEYSLEVDPLDQYHMSEKQKEFIRHYVNFKNINVASDLAEIDFVDAKKYYLAYETQQEIRRLNRALYQRQFHSKLLTIDQLGGYLTSLLTGEYLPISDQLKTAEKLKVVDLILKLNEMKAKSFVDPTEIMQKDLEVQIKDLSITSIQNLLYNDNKQLSSKDIVNTNNATKTLSAEEKEYLSSLPTKDILALLEETNKKEG